MQQVTQTIYNIIIHLSNKQAIRFLFNEALKDLGCILGVTWIKNKGIKRDFFFFLML